MDMNGHLKPAALHILAALAEGQCHGYAVMQRVRERSGGAVPLQTGSFYRHLARLIEGGLVAAVTRVRPADDPRRGAYYRLTTRGHDELAAERRRLAALVAALRPRKGHA
jgi:DNA-binding PadR family transcriptional regulator